MFRNYTFALCQFIGFEPFLRDSVLSHCLTNIHLYNEGYPRQAAEVKSKVRLLCTIQLEELFLLTIDSSFVETLVFIISHS